MSSITFHSRDSLTYLQYVLAVGAYVARGEDGAISAYQAAAVRERMKKPIGALWWRRMPQGQLEAIEALKKERDPYYRASKWEGAALRAKASYKTAKELDEFLGLLDKEHMSITLQHDTVWECQACVGWYNKRNGIAPGDSR